MKTLKQIIAGTLIAGACLFGSSGCETEEYNYESNSYEIVRTLNRIYNLPEASETGVVPFEGKYNFDEGVGWGSFSVMNDNETGEKYIRFSKDRYRFDNIPIFNGKFRTFNTSDPYRTDWYALEGHFVNERRAEGYITYTKPSNSSSNSIYAFTAELK